MAQNIGCDLINENGVRIKDSNLNFAPLHSLLQKIDEKADKFPWLHTIDEYGDTIFNHLQVPIIVVELENLKNEGTQEDKLAINKLIEFINGVDQGRYVRFMGD